MRRVIIPIIYEKVITLDKQHELHVFKIPGGAIVITDLSFCCCSGSSNATDVMM